MKLIKKEWHLFATELGLKNYQVILSEYEYSSKKNFIGIKVMMILKS
ncbi:hypothetical protein [Lentilactobacillus laojiaonis]|nr:hypothetical protein [Lentilactobacillus laojiaonis]UDM32704.1 hypothetical protein LHL71_03095 [Lentilactobacillus laojiaonis]